MDCVEMKGVSAECVRDVDAKRWTSSRKMDNLADGGVAEIVSG